MTKIFNYCPDEVNALVAGIVPLNGFVDGTFIEISKDLQAFTPARSSDGIVARVGSRDQTYTIKITLHCGSETNDLLTKLWLLDEATQMGKFPLIVKDNSGGDLFFSTTTWIESPAMIDKSTGVDSRVWVMRSSQAVINVGGNSDPSSLIDDITNIVLGSIPALQGVI